MRQILNSGTRKSREYEKRLKRRLYKVRGPNYMWHTDGNDKMKGFGFAISVCINGFSRNLIWLEVARSNKNLKLICQYFLYSVVSLNKLPLVDWMDRGTQDVHIASSQQMLREEHHDSLVNIAVMFGSSNHNQRIERYRSYLKVETHYSVSVACVAVILQ